MFETLMICASLLAIDGDTVRCGKGGELLRLLGGGVPFVSGIDTPEKGSHAKCIKERKLALIAKARLAELLKTEGIRVMASGARDKTPSRRPLVNIYLPDGTEIGRKMLEEGFAREWRPGRRNDWCGE